MATTQIARIRDAADLNGWAADEHQAGYVTFTKPSRDPVSVTFGPHTGIVQDVTGAGRRAGARASQLERVAVAIHALDD